MPMSADALRRIAALAAMICAGGSAFATPTVIEFGEIGASSSAAALSAFYSPVVFTTIGGHVQYGVGNNGADNWIVASDTNGLLQLDFSTAVSDLVLRWGSFAPITIQIYDINGLLNTYTNPAAGAGVGNPVWGIADFTGFSGITSVVAHDGGFQVALTRMEFDQAQIIPLPTSAGLGLAGLAGLALRRRR